MVGSTEGPFQPEATLGHKRVEQPPEDDQADADRSPAVLIAADTRSEQHEQGQYEDGDSECHHRSIRRVLQPLLHAHDIAEGEPEDSDAQICV